MAGVRDRAAPEPRPSARHNCRSVRREIDAGSGNLCALGDDTCRS